MNKYLILAALSFVFIESSFAQSRGTCLISCPRITPVCVDGGHAASYLIGPVNECTLKDEVFCQGQALTQAQANINLLSEENTKLSETNEIYRREILRLNRLLKLLRVNLR